MVTESIALIYLGILVFWDARKREIPVNLLLMGTVLAVGTALCRLGFGGGTWAELLLGSIPGIVLLNLAWLTKNVGLGDGIVLLQLDLFLLLERVVMTFAISLMVIGGFALILLLFRRSKKNLRLPYMPFLWIGCLLAWLVCG